MSPGMKEMIDAADAVVPRITPHEARTLMANGDVLVVDVREPAEIEASGKIAGAVNVTGAMLQSRADPNSPRYNPSFNTARTVILYCASGVRSALAGRLLKEMGYERVLNLGGFKDWAAAGGDVEKV